MATVSIPATANNFSNKKANGVSKLKHCKLDAPRYQWLPKAKTNSMNGEGIMINTTQCEPENLGINSPKGESSGFSDFSYIESLSNSHTSSTLGCSDSVTHFTGSIRSDSSSSSSCCGSLSDEECFDDWEAIADALAASDRKHDNSETYSLTINNRFNPNCASKNKAWRVDDTFRPKSLPKLLNQNSFSTSSEYHPLPCPICCEDLDFTDSSFLPCPCGFSLCLFCHKRILEGDGRCPGCRAPYSAERESSFGWI